MRRVFAIVSGVALLITASCQSEQLAYQEVGLEGTACPADWYTIAPPDPSWGFPDTLADMLPIHYYDTETMSALFPVPITPLATVLPAGLLPLEIAPGVGAVDIAFLNHHSVDYLSPYHEMAVLVLTYDPSALAEGYLPYFQLSSVVTSEQAIWKSGAWNLPVTLGNTMCHQLKPKGFKCMASADDQLVMKVEIQSKYLTMPNPTNPINKLEILTVKDGYLLRTAWVQHGDYFTNTANQSEVTLKLGDHPMAQQLRDLGVGSYPSMGQYWAPTIAVALDRGVCTPLP